MRPPTPWLLPLLLALGCSRPVTSDALGLQYEPPSGVSFASEEAGPPAVAHFEGGLELRSVPGPELPLETPPEEVFRLAGVSLPGKAVQQARGTLPAGAVARYEFLKGNVRTLVYVLPRPDRFVLVTFSAPESDYGPRSSRVERSLSTLKLLR
ncbi:hypothetical protein SAMN05444354_103261 [Stigmatella aurantiaca]|uniref:Lipoprotein n=1 Tax=Stigmatella aurantiaca TaxID=41 RepID=A0A1H7LLH0_STIAU|nr:MULTISPECIES: hypothetical protein [Stigmatella]SEK99237.1 hypothetical protein SAMN05444354_103261 [Stigmatella aurantiaca]